MLFYFVGLVKMALKFSKLFFVNGLLASVKKTNKTT